MKSNNAPSDFFKSKFNDAITDFVDKDEITVVIPTLNEEMGIGPVLEGLSNQEYYNILIVDGYSSDATIDIVKEYGINVIHQHGIGKAGAIRTAIEHVNTPYMVIIDGDFTYDPKDVDLFLPHLKYYSQIIGSRKDGRENISKFNRFGNWVINKTFNLLFGTNLTDVCSGLYALNSRFAKGMVLTTKGFDVEVEIAAQSSEMGSITEVPISFSSRLGIQKLQPLRDGWSIMSTMFKLSRTYNSIIFYSFVAACSIIPSAILLAWVALEWMRGVWHSGVALFGVMLAILSAQSLVLSTMASHQKRMEQRILKKIHNTIS